jgi:hypothetical protein
MKYFLTFVCSAVLLFTFATPAHAQGIDIHIIPETITFLRDPGLTGSQIQQILGMLRSFGLTPSQIVDINDRLIRKQFTIKPADKTILTRDLTVGSEGEDVRELQRFLNNNSMTVVEFGAGSPGKESTYFGEKTKKALLKFQQTVGINPAHGMLDQNTRTIITR